MPNEQQGRDSRITPPSSLKGLLIRIFVLLVLVPAAKLLCIDASKQNSHDQKVRPASSIPLTAQLLRAAELDIARKSSQRELATALRQLRQEAHSFRVRGFRDQAAADYLSMGDIYLTWSQYPQAWNMYRFAQALAPKKATDLRRFILSHMAVAYASFRDPIQSLTYSREALNLEGDRSPQATAEVLVALGLGLLYSDSQQAIDILHSAENESASVQDADGEALASLYRGVAFLQIGDLHKALQEESRALHLWESSGNTHGIAEAHFSLGLLYSTGGEPDRAVTEYQQARQGFRRIDDRDNEGSVLNGLGVVSRDLGSYETAFSYHQEARRIFAAIGDPLGELSAIDGAAKALWSLHNYSAARLLYQTELRRARQTRNLREEASALGDVGDIHFNGRSYDQAETLYHRSLILCQRIKHPFGEMEAWLRFGSLYLETGRYPQALQSFQHALELATSNGRPAKQAQAHYELARLYQASRQMEQAKAEAENATQIIESERTKVSDFGSRASYFASVHEYYQVYVDILAQLHQKFPDKNFAQLAFEASEKSKVRSLLDMLASNIIHQASCFATPQTQPSDSPAVSSQGSNPSCSQVAPSALSLTEVQAALHGDDAVLLEYALGPDVSHLWAVEEGQLFSYSLPGEAQISKLATAFHSALIARQPLENEDAAHYDQRVIRADARLADISYQLSDVLLGPVSHLLERKRIIIVPDGSLRYVPFAALPLPGDDDREPLAAKHEITNLPSASILGALRLAAAKRLEPTAVAAVFADPVFSRDDPRFSGGSPVKIARQSNSVALGLALRDTGFGSAVIPRLPGSRIEAKTIADALSGNNVLLALDFNASRSGVLAADLGQYRYIHFATHGLLDSRHPEFSGLILSLVNEHGQPQDGYLRMRDIYGLKLSADLVVLSSCNSALGKDLQSEGIIGLPRAFLYAGSQRVISSLWKVDDEASAELMSHFYSRLRTGESPAAALREAQIALAENPHWRHPYYWATFILQGEYR